jgi:hypothetical protein
VSIFVSYSQKDEKWAREFIHHLSQEGIDVWDAESELSPGDNWNLEVGKALERANAMIVLLSPASARSENLRKEIEYALGSRKFQDRLIPVIVKPTHQIPWILKRFKPIRGSDPSRVSGRVARRLKAGAESN